MSSRRHQITRPVYYIISNITFFSVCDGRQPQTSPQTPCLTPRAACLSLHPKTPSLNSPTRPTLFQPPSQFSEYPNPISLHLLLDPITLLLPQTPFLFPLLSDLFFIFRVPVVSPPTPCPFAQHSLLCSFTLPSSPSPELLLLSQQLRPFTPPPTVP